MTKITGICWGLAYFLQRYATSCLLGFIAAMVFYWIYSLGLDTGQNKIASFRYRDIHTANALSHLVPGHPKDYTAYPEAQALAKELSSGRFTLQQIIEKLKTEVAKSRSVSEVAFAQEDKGTTDFVKFAFQLFGFQLESLYSMYFIVLCTPILTYFLCFFRNPARLTMLIFLLLSLYAITFIMGQYDPVNISGLHEPRFFSSVSIISLMHILLVISDAGKNPFTLKTLAGVSIQICAILFAYHTRSDALWQILCIYCTIPIFFLLREKRIRNTWKFMLHLTLPAVLMTLGMIGLNAYVKLTYNKVYFSESSSRGHTFWNAMLSGLSVHPDFRRKYQIINGDDDLFKIVERTRGEPCDSPQCVENEQKKIVVSIIQTYPWKTLQTYFFYHPQFWLKERLSINNHPPLISQGLNYNPFRSEILALLVFTVMLVYKKSRGQWRSVLLACGFTTVFSFLPPFIVGSAVHIATITYVTTAMFIYTIVLAGIAWLYSLYTCARPSKHDMAVAQEF